MAFYFELFTTQLGTDEFLDNVSEPPVIIHYNVAQNVEIVETQIKWGDVET